MEYRDYYSTLGVSKDAKQADIKKAFRKLAREHHPDVNKGDSKAEKRFKEVSEAHEVLSDPKKRTAYDQLGADWSSYGNAGAAGARGGATGGPHAGFGGAGQPGGVRFEFRGNSQDVSGFSEFFRTFFAGGSSSAGAAAPSSGAWQPTASGNVDREPLYGGLGGDAGAGHSASGFGTASPRGTRRRAPSDATAQTTVDLNEVLNGTERVLEIGETRLQVRIPPGVKHGQRIRLSGKAESGGNVYLTVHVRPHPNFTRDGANLSRELPLTLGEALLGAEVTVDTLSGKKLLLTIPPGTQSGRLFRLAGQGLPQSGSDDTGDLLLRTRIVLPEALDDKGSGLARDLIHHIDQPDPRLPDADEH
jgi:DnaJ-class molecular chaperone